MLSQDLLDRIRVRAETALTRTDLLPNVRAELMGKAAAAQISTTENELGFSLPRDLVELYMQIANGGFGPGYGIIGVAAGWTDDQGATLAPLYQECLRRRKPQDPAWRWPERLLPFCYLGCASYSCIDCNSEAARIVAADSEVDGWPEECPSLREWIATWAAGEDMRARYSAVVSPLYPS